MWGGGESWGDDHHSTSHFMGPGVHNSPHILPLSTVDPQCCIYNREVCSGGYDLGHGGRLLPLETDGIQK